MGTLNITDGTITVSFLDPAGLYIKRDGYRQKVGHIDPETGEIPDVVDVLPCVWMVTTDDSRDTTLINLHRLAAKAQAYRRNRRKTDEVWMTMQTHSETNIRYCIVSDVQIAELEGGHFGANSIVDLIVTITREGAGRAVAPNGTPATVAAATTLYMKNDTDGTNGLTIAPASVPGDAPMLTTIEIDPGTTNPIPIQYMVATKAFDDATKAGQFDPLFEPTSELDNAGLQVADTNAPDDVKLRSTADATLRWSLASGSRPLSVYAGDYLVFAAFEKSGIGTVTAQFSHGQGYITQPPIAVVSGGGTPATLHFLGRHRLPGGQYNPSLTNPTGYNLLLIMDVTGTATWDFFQMWLVPIPNVLELRGAAIDTNGVVVMDGIKELSYEKSTGGVWRESSSSLFDARGQYIQLEPGRYNRLFFFLQSNAGLVVFNWDFSVTIKGVARHLGIRGNT
ncbi:MAG: hypothetical protein KJ063_02365 [Anaerolineae bacterium]|nr:hypothetical protein [Anaerolineae bacterium]